MATPNDRSTRFRFVTRIHRNFRHEPRRRDAGGGEVAGDGLGGVAARAFFHETDLHRLVTVRLFRFPLYNNARPGLDHCDGNCPPLVVEDLGHADLFAEYSAYHELTSPRTP